MPAHAGWNYAQLPSTLVRRLSPDLMSRIPAGSGAATDAHLCAALTVTRAFANRELPVQERGQF
jgi:hypothetical protein